MWDEINDLDLCLAMLFLEVSKSHSSGKFCELFKK